MGTLHSTQGDAVQPLEYTTAAGNDACAGPEKLKAVIASAITCTDKSLATAPHQFQVLRHPANALLKNVLFPFHAINCSLP
jgi:hypothetical protein